MAGLAALPSGMPTPVEIVAVGIVTVPVKVGLASAARPRLAAVRSPTVMKELLAPLRSFSRLVLVSAHH